MLLQQIAAPPGELPGQVDEREDQDRDRDGDGRVGEVYEAVEARFGAAGSVMEPSLGTAPALTSGA